MSGVCLDGGDAEVVGGGRDVSKSRLPKRGAERPFMSPLSLSDGLIAVTTVVKELVCNFGSR